MKRGTQQIRCHLNTLIDLDVIRLSEVGDKGVSDNVRVVSIVGRFLEHARIFAFTARGETAYWIGSADMMARNLDNRVELVAPIDDPTYTASRRS